MEYQRFNNHKYLSLKILVICFRVSAFTLSHHDFDAKTGKSPAARFNAKKQGALKGSL